MAPHFTYPTHYLDTEIVAHARPTLSDFASLGEENKRYTRLHVKAHANGRSNGLTHSMCTQEDGQRTRPQDSIIYVIPPQLLVIRSEISNTRSSSTTLVADK